MTRPTYTVQVDWDNDGTWTDTGEDVTARVLARAGVVVQYGRDQARALTPVAPGRAQFELNNRSGDYSPDRSDSPLFGDVKPGRPVRIQATHNSTTYTLYLGYLDDFDVLPDVEERSVALSAIDALGQFRGRKITTTLYRGIRTGTAVGHILDAAGWSAPLRDLDLGATVIPWWWEDNADAFDALQRVMEAEGPPALLTVGADGSVVFRDRHHRITEAASLTSQATFRGAVVEPTMATRLVYDHGFRDLVNSVTVEVGERAQLAIDVVWSSPDVVSLGASESRTIIARTSDPFTGAVTPVAGTDYTVLTGSVSSITLSRTSGASTAVTITATGSGVSLRDLQLRAQPVSVQRTVVVTETDSTSITDHGERAYGRDVPWVGVHDAKAVALMILNHYAQRRPAVSMRVVGGHDTRHTQQLARDLSDRVHIIETETGLDDDFYVESIQHRFDGVAHETTFGCEKAPTDPVDADEVFLFGGGAGHRFGEGKFAV